MNAHQRRVAKRRKNALWFFDLEASTSLWGVRGLYYNNTIDWLTPEVIRPAGPAQTNILKGRTGVLTTLHLSDMDFTKLEERILATFGEQAVLDEYQ